jgi:CBS domain-containing protein
MRIRDVMTSTVVTVTPDTPVREVARLLDEHRISGLPVVDADGGLVGVVSEADFLAEASRSIAPERRSAIARLFSRGDDAPDPDRHPSSTAGDLMTSPVISVSPDELVVRAAATMTGQRINRLPVVEEGRLVGIVTRADLVRAYVRSDVELAEAVRSEVLLGALWLDPSKFEVSVVDGVATISGTVDRRSSAEMIRRSAAMLPGIVDVVTDVRWAVDDEELKPPTPGPEFPYSPA